MKTVGAEECRAVTAHVTRADEPRREHRGCQAARPETWSASAGHHGFVVGPAIRFSHEMCQGVHRPRRRISRGVSVTGRRSRSGIVSADVCGDHTVRLACLRFRARRSTTSWSACRSDRCITAATAETRAVLLLPVPRDVTWMQKVAREMNLSETAFLVQRPVLRASPRWELRSEMVHASD